MLLRETRNLSVKNRVTVYKREEEGLCTCAVWVSRRDPPPPASHSRGHMADGTLTRSFAVWYSVHTLICGRPREHVCQMFVTWPGVGGCVCVFQGFEFCLLL